MQKSLDANLFYSEVLKNFSQNQNNSNEVVNSFSASSAKNAILIFPKSISANLEEISAEVFFGFGIGKKAVTTGEICFNTALTGYQEILTDPSYMGQIINFTFPHIGNVGTNAEDIEASQVKASGLIVNQRVTDPSNYRSNQHLNDWLIANNLTGISGVDTRRITKLIKAHGARSVAIIYLDEVNQEVLKQAIATIAKSSDLKGVELASQASLNKEYVWGNEAKWQQVKNSYNFAAKKTGLKVVAVDFGAKLNILRCLTEVGVEVEIVGSKATFADIMKHNPDGVFLSNGPGDPAETGKYAIPMIQEVLKNKIPLFGICLGHQILALAIGGKTSKMHQGHRGANHPVLNLQTKKVEITSQNHGFCVDAQSLPNNAQVTHISLFDNTVEGLELLDAPAFSVQYHPESSPGPDDSFYLFERFLKSIEEKKNERN